MVLPAFAFRGFGSPATSDALTLLITMGVPKQAVFMEKIFNLFYNNRLMINKGRLVVSRTAVETQILTEEICQNGISARQSVCRILPWLFLLLLAPGFLSAEPVGNAPQAPGSGGPDSLTVGEVRLVRRPIFSPEEERSGTPLVGLLRRFMNRVHVVTRKSVIRRELLFHPGERLRPALLAETERNLRSLGFLNDITVAPADTLAGGRVPIVVDTRESWTLKTDFSYTQASGGDTRWNVQLSDTNFLGYGVTMGTGIGGDENSNYWNLWYRQRRILGTALWFGADDSERADGYARTVFLNRPFWSEADRWSLATRYWDRSFEQRYYLSNAGPAGEDPRRGASLHALFPRQEQGAEAGVLLRVHGKQRGRIWRQGLGMRWSKVGYGLDGRGQELSDGRNVDLGWLAGAGQPLGRDQGTTVWPYFEIQTHGRGWTKNRFIMQYGAIEDINLAPVVDVKVGPVPGAMGTTSAGGTARWRAEGTWEQWVVSGPGLILLKGTGEAEWGSDEADYHLYTVLAGWMGHTGAEETPWLTKVFAEYGHGDSLEGTKALTLGLDRGLRTLEFDGMAGDRLARLTMEEGKVFPGEMLGMFRYGVGAFVATGAAWWHDEDRGLDDARREAGCGLRFGPTRSANAATGRIDLVWDLDHGGGPVMTATTRGYF